MVEGHFIGVDVGGTKIASAAMTSGGEHEEPLLTPTVTDSTDALLDQLAAVIENLRTPDTRAVGIGVPSVVEFRTGRIRFSVNIPLADVPVREILSDRLGLPVFVENDASCAALAEAYDRGELISPDLVMFTIGTGVGGGIVLGGKLFRGVTGAAPEIGHMVIGLDLTDDVMVPEGKPPRPGSLESLAAGTELDRLAMRFAREMPDSELARLLRVRGRLIGRDAVEAAQAGDAAGLRAMTLLGKRLGIGIANAINIFDPGEIVVGGGVSGAGDLLLGPACEVYPMYVLPGVGTETKVRLARRGPEAGVIGAAMVAAQEHGAAI